MPPTHTWEQLVSERDFDVLELRVVDQGADEVGAAQVAVEIVVGDLEAVGREQIAAAAFFVNLDFDSRVPLTEIGAAGGEAHNLLLKKLKIMINWF